MPFSWRRRGSLPGNRAPNEREPPHALTPMRESPTATTSLGALDMRPPTLEYSPSVFSRTTKKSMSPGLRSASGLLMPGMRRHGRRFTYWSKSRRNLMSMPQSDT
jgi:hypothetical protein